jgi:hypothetical protein
MNSTVGHRLLPLAFALLAAGCGAAAPAADTSGSQNDVQALKYAQCMQQHGIDASVDGHNVAIGGNGQTYSRQQMQDAQTACKQYLPNGGRSTPPPSAEQLDRVARYAQCLDQHGVPAQAQGGVLRTGGGDPEKWAQAEKACQQYAGSGPIQAAPGPAR